MNLLLLVLAGASCVALWILEWRRPNQRRRFWRLTATAGAVTALAALSVPRAPEAGHAGGPTAATLWTPGADLATASAQGLVLALPDASQPAPPGTVPLPDAGTLRRRYPGLRSLQILGAGLDVAELSAFSGLHLAFDPAKSAASIKPEPVFLSYPRTVALGQAFRVEGRLAGLSAGATTAVTLEAPDGSTAKTLAGPADAQGEAGFRLEAPALPATGRFLWRLHAGAGEEPLGVSVVVPVLPRVLVLDSAPNFDTAALRRWYAEAGGTLLARTQVGRGLFRYAAARGDAPPFATLDAAFLDAFDLVVTDPAALATLAPEESAALLAAIYERGVGLLVRAEEGIAAKSDSPGLTTLFPWKLTPDPSAPANEERAARPRWPGQSTVAEGAVPVSRLELELSPPQSALVDDGQGRTLAAAVRHGRGFVALTLVHETTRWPRANDPTDFAAY